MRIAVIGARGFVGRHVVPVLRQGGTEVVEIGKVDFATIDRQLVRPCDVVVNLAYPNDVAPRLSHSVNRRLAAMTDHLLCEGGMIVQVSSLAVFGMGLDRRSPAAAPVRKRRDHPYVEAKIDLEHLLARRATHHPVEIVRLGNVWGPGSALWTAGLAERVLFGEPVLVKENDGYSNVTDVHNVAVYLRQVTHSLARPCGVRFHHLAEFANVPWSYWVSRLAELLSVDSVLSFDPPGRQNRPLAMRALWNEIVWRMKASEAAASTLNTLLSKLPERVIEYLRLASVKASPTLPCVVDQPDLVRVLSCRVQFTSQLHFPTEAFLNLEESWRRSAAWLDTAGFCAVAGGQLQRRDLVARRLDVTDCTQPPGVGHGA